VYYFLIITTLFGLLQGHGVAKDYYKDI